MDNRSIAKSLETLADVLEIQGANAFRLRAYRTGAQVIAGSSESVADVIQSGEDLTKWQGVGKGVAQKCTELVQTGKLQQLEELFEEIPKSILDLLRIPNLGPKKVAAIFKELGITDLDALKEACEKNEVQKLKGFAAKTEKTILEGIDIARAGDKRSLWYDVDRIVDQLRNHLSQVESIEKMEFAGSYRRGKETVGDIDILVVAVDHNEVMDSLESYADHQKTLVRGDTKISTRLHSEIQIDLRVVPEKSFGAALQYFTGSQEHNVEVRKRAKAKKLKINEWGVFSVGSPAEEANDPNLEGWVAGITEKDVYAAIDCPWIDPNLREHHKEFQWADANEMPKLIELDDIRGDLHMHTNASDGTSSIMDMVQAAKSRGLKYIAITDHSKRVAVANGLDAKRVQKQWELIDKINEELGSKFKVLKSIECDILEDGSLDLPNEVLAKADWVMGSVHFGTKQSKKEITDRIVGAIQHPSISAISHPTGRILNRRPAYEIDMKEVISQAKANGKFLELNASPKRLDLNEVHLKMAIDAGVKIVISTDAHSPESLESMRCGIQQARRAGLEAANIANTLTWPKLKKLIGNY